MTEHIDHTAKARTLERNAWAKGGPDGDSFIRTHEQRQDMILSAQMHATLALAEQQRIANLIALARVECENSSTPTDALDALYTREEQAWGAKLHTRLEIRKGLGL